MGLFSKLFGGSKEEPQGQSPQEREAAIARFEGGAAVSVDRITDGLDDDDAFELLWRLLEASSDASRVDVIDRLAEFDLDQPQQRRLALAAVERVAGPTWTAVSVAQSCDLGAMAEEAAQEPHDEPMLTAVAALLGALAESALTTGPAGDAMDVPKAVEYTLGWVEALGRCGARPLDLVTLRLARTLCDHEDVEREARKRGWNEDLASRLDTAWVEVRDREPRGGGAWAERLLTDVSEGSVDVATPALMMAPIFEVDTAAVLLARVAGAPSDDDSWTLTLLGTPTKEILDVLVPTITADLQGRRLCEDDLNSPASQVGCKKCGGPPGSEEDALMVPKQLEQRTLAILGAISRHPGYYGEFIFEALAAPSPSLRFNASLVLQNWPVQDINESTWDLLESLQDDSVPQVSELVEALLTSREQQPA